MERLEAVSIDHSSYTVTCEADCGIECRVARLRDWSRSRKDGPGQAENVLMAKTRSGGREGRSPSISWNESRRPNKTGLEDTNPIAHII